jgi:hypothetical protein
MSRRRAALKPSTITHTSTPINPMKFIKYTIQGLFLCAAIAALSNCTTTEHEVVVVHSTPRPMHHTSTAPADFGVVNQYDRSSR